MPSRLILNMRKKFVLAVVPKEYPNRRGILLPAVSSSNTARSRFTLGEIVKRLNMFCCIVGAVFKLAPVTSSFSCGVIVRLRLICPEKE